MTDAITRIPIAEAKPSPHNRRHDQGDLKALAESIGRHGIIQPLVGRELADGTVEIVAGERRLRAAKLARLGQVPVILRELTDEQARESCLEENLQREDIHPMDEAESYEQLRADHGYTVEQLADRFGRSTTHVSKRLKLLGLIKPARKLYLEGKLDDRGAFAIARIADPKGQETVLEDVRPNDNEHDWRWEDIEQRIKRDWMHDLAGAPFDVTDELLYIEAGACSACPKRTGQQRELFPEATKKEDLCLDRACYLKKVDVWWQGERVAAVEAGAKVLSKKETEAEFHYGNLAYGSKYVPVTRQLGEVVGDYKSQKQIKTVLKKDPPQRVLARDAEGKVHELYDRKEVAAKLKAAGHLTKTAASAAASGASPQVKATEAREKKRRAIRARAIDLAIAAAGDVVQAHGDATLFPLARLLCQGAAASSTSKARKLKPGQLDEELDARVLDGDVSWVMRLVVELALRDAVYYDGSMGPAFTAAMVAWGLDLEAIEAEAKAEVTAELAAKKAKAKKKAKATK